jgi:hypothetical protein
VTRCAAANSATPPNRTQTLDTGAKSLYPAPQKSLEIDGIYLNRADSGKR